MGITSDSYVPPIVIDQSPERARRLREYLALLRRQGHGGIAWYIEQILTAPIMRWEDR